MHRSTIVALDQDAAEHCVIECDIIADPRRAERSYAKANLRRLQRPRQQYDLEGLFQDISWSTKCAFSDCADRLLSHSDS
jgi:hypothetical protein